MVIDNPNNFQAPYRRVLGEPAYPIYVEPGESLVLAPKAYRGTTIGLGTVGTLTFGSACHAFNFFNQSSSTAVEISFDATTWLPLGANGNWEMAPPGAYASQSITEIYHRKTTSGTSNWAVQSWEEV